MAARGVKRTRTDNGTTAGGHEEVKAVEPRLAMLEKWKADEEAAETMIPMIGHMYRTQNVIVNVYDRSLVNQAAIDIVKIHKFASTNFDSIVSVHNSLAILKALSHVSLVPMKIDLGKTAVLVKDILAAADAHTEEDLVQKLVSRLAVDLSNMGSVPSSLPARPRDIVLYGFGRIGRLLARVLIEKTGAGVKMLLRAIVVRPAKEKDSLAKRASLLMADSVHGPFAGTIEVDETNSALIINGNLVHIINANDPSTVDYTKYGIADAVVIDNTGVWRDAAGLSKHLKCPGASKVILTAPPKGDDVVSIVAGVNNDRISDDINIFAAASCTTNAIVPVLKVIDEEYGILHGHVETVHSFTNDQNLIDNYHAKARRGRSAALNMVLTETGAASAVAQSLPHLTGRITGNAIRVPTPDVSMAVMILQLNREVTEQEVNDYIRKQATFGALHLQVGASFSEDAVSTDFVGDRRAGIVDCPATIADGKNLNLYVWYDNEFGYTCQVVRLVQRICGIKFPTFPASNA